MSPESSLLFDKFKLNLTVVWIKQENPGPHEGSLEYRSEVEKRLKKVVQVESTQWCDEVQVPVTTQHSESISHLYLRVCVCFQSWTVPSD